MVSLRRAGVVALLLVLVAGIPALAAAPRTVALGVARIDSRDLAEIDAFTAEAGGHPPAIWTLWVQWGGTDPAFPPAALMDGIVARGAVPMINWEPVDPADETSPRFRYRRMNAGVYDAYIRAFARDAAAWGGPVYLRFAHEMNGTWFPWGIGRFDNTPARFRAAWRRIHGIFRAEGATNVRFLWSPYRVCPWCTRYAPLYPGDRYVDATSFSAFNWNNTWLPWLSMADLYGSSVRALLEVAPRKRIIVAETGSSNERSGKAAWIAEGYPAVRERYPRILAIVWFDVRMPTHPDWRLTEPPEAMAAYAAIAAQPEFQRDLRD